MAMVLLILGPALLSVVGAFLYMRTQRQGRFEREDEERRQQREEVEAEAQRQLEKATKAADAEERPAFLDAVSRETFADTNINSVADRINQQKHYVQRGTSAAAENFM